MRQVVLDTETTGKYPDKGHRIIEIGCVEVVNRRITGETFHSYFNPQREIDRDAEQVHKINLASLLDKPLFAAVCDELLDFVRGAELIIHNAEFDLGFLNAELGRLGRGGFTDESGCTVLDTLELARNLHPGQRNSVDALCLRYNIDSSSRTAHGALLDAQLLVRVYFAMTSEQATLSLLPETAVEVSEEAALAKVSGLDTPVIYATADELVSHEQFMRALEKS